MKIFWLLPDRSVFSLTRPAGTCGYLLYRIILSPGKDWLCGANTWAQESPKSRYECVSIHDNPPHTNTHFSICASNSRGLNHCPSDETCDSEELCLSCITAPGLQTSSPRVFVSLVGFHDYSSKWDFCSMPPGINPGLCSTSHVSFLTESYLWLPFPWSLHTSKH